MFYVALLPRVNNQSVTMIPILKVSKNKYNQEENGQTLSNDIDLWRELLILSFFYDSSYALL